MPALPRSSEFVETFLEDLRKALLAMTCVEWDIELQYQMRNHYMKLDLEAPKLFISDTAVRRLMPHRTYRERTTVDRLITTRGGFIVAVVNQVVMRHTNAPFKNLSQTEIGRAHV